MLTFRMSVLQHTFSKRLTLSKMYVVTYESSQVELFKMHCFTMFVTNLCLNFLMKFSTFLRVSSLSDTRFPADLYPWDMSPLQWFNSFQCILWLWRQVGFTSTCCLRFETIAFYLTFLELLLGLFRAFYPTLTSLFSLLRIWSWTLILSDPIFIY